MDSRHDVRQESVGRMTEGLVN